MIAILMGSKSDYEIVKQAIDLLNFFSINHIVKILSVHRTMHQLYEFINENQDMDLFIAAAGGSAALPGVIASLTTKPVIGIPINKSLGGIDAFLSISQMPKGCPVATMSIDGAFNAALLAAQMLAITDKELSNKLKVYKENMAKQILGENL